MNNIQQNLLQAIDLIAINQASAVNFDTTEIATVLSKLENGNYWVSNGKVKYEAKSTETISYTENTQVYVSISQGDYSQDKVIIGRYDNRKEEEKAYLYEDPYQRLGVSHIVVMESNEKIIDFNSTALGQPTLLGVETSVNINTKPKDGCGYYGLWINLLNNNNETLMSFIIDSRNFIGNPYNMVSGIKHKNIFTLPNDFNISDVKKIKVEGYGDVKYELWSSITLRFGYDLESETIINSESKVFIGTDNGLNTYGEGDNDSYREVLIKKFDEFKENTAPYINHIEAFDNDLNTKNAFKCGSGQNDARCQIFLDEGIQGFNLETNIKYQIKFKYFVKTNSIYIGTNNNKIYGIAGMHQRDTNIFFGNTINLDKDPGQWHEAILDFVINSNNQYYSFAIKLNFGSPENYLGDINPYIYIKDFEIYKLQPISLNNLYFSWVKDGQVYNPNNPTSLETSVSWYKYAPNKIDEDLGVGWEKINNENNWTLDVSDNYLDYNIPEERFRARLIYNDVDYLSNVLVLKNKDYVGESAAAVSPTMTLRLNDDGIYLYDHTAQLYETEKTLKTISASSNAGFEDDYRDLYWLIPKNSTMIAAPRLIEKKKEGATEYWYWDYLPDIHFSTKPTDFTSSVSYLKDYDLDTNNYYVIGGNGIKLEQNIYIKRSYQPNYLNNTIQCKAFFGDTSTPNEEGSVDLKFISVNSSGVEASLGIELVSEKGYLGGDNTGNIEVKGVVYDKNGIPFEEQPTINYEILSSFDIYEGSYTSNSNYWELPGDTSGDLVYRYKGDFQDPSSATILFKNNGDTDIDFPADQYINIDQDRICYVNIENNNGLIRLMGDTPRNMTSGDNYSLLADISLNNITLIIKYITTSYDKTSNKVRATEITNNVYEIIIPKECKFWINIYPNDRTQSSEIKFTNLPIVKKATCVWNSENTGKQVQLTSYYQIPYFPTENIYHLEGPTKFTYSSFGDMPYPASINKYKLFDSNGREISNFNMSINTDNIKINNSKHTIALPELAPAEESFYILDIKNENGELIAQYPLTLLRNGYAFKEINAWGGSTVTTEDYVISPMIGAGSKNASNQFTGVIMGTSSEFPQTGLYGFKNGVATFGFKEDGSCFLGANEETGRIEFNTGGNSELTIRAKDFRLESNSILIDRSNITLKGNTSQINFEDLNNSNFNFYLKFNSDTYDLGQGIKNLRNEFEFNNGQTGDLLRKFTIQFNTNNQNAGPLLNLAGAGFVEAWFNPFQTTSGYLRLLKSNGPYYTLEQSFDSIQMTGVQEWSVNDKIQYQSDGHLLYFYTNTTFYNNFTIMQGSDGDSIKILKNSIHLPTAKAIYFNSESSDSEYINYQDGVMRLSSANSTASFTYNNKKHYNLFTIFGHGATVEITTCGIWVYNKLVLKF